MRAHFAPHECPRLSEKGNCSVQASGGDFFVSSPTRFGVTGRGGLQLWWLCQVSNHQASSMEVGGAVQPHARAEQREEGGVERGVVLVDVLAHMVGSDEWHAKSNPRRCHTTNNLTPFILFFKDMFERHS